MTAPVPLSLEVLLQAVVEACVEELATARREVAIVRAATAAERRGLERRIAELEKGDDALRVTLPNGIEVRTETEAEASALLDWLMAAPEVVTSPELPRTPAKRGTYQKHTLGPVQSKIVEALKDGPLQHRELAEATGAADRNLRYTLISMTARGLVVRGWNQLREVVVYALPGVELPPVPEDRPHKGVRAGETAKPSKVRPPTTNEVARPEPAAPAPRRGRPPIDLTGTRVASFVCIGRAEGTNHGGQPLWRFRCELCGEERTWAHANISAVRARGGELRCVCQGGRKPKSTGRAYRGPGQPVRHIPVEREHVNLDEDMTDLDDGFRGDPEELKGLASGGLGFE